MGVALCLLSSAEQIGHSLTQNPAVVLLVGYSIPCIAVMFSRRGRKQSSSPRTARVENNEEEPNPKSLLYLDHFVDILFTGKLRADENEQYQQFVIRDSGALHSVDKKLSLQVTQATVTPDVKKRTFRIVENESRLSQTTFTGVVKTQSKAHFAIWDYFFSTVQEASRLNDRYLCIAAGRIGIGPHGVIFKAMRKDDGDVVALKVVPRRIPDANASFSCTRVCRAIRDQWLRSPCLIQVLDVFHSKNETQIVMPLLGTTLEALISTPWQEAKAQVLFRRLIHALSAMHRVGFVHGSVVPGNIMVETEHPSLAIRLGGFGLSVVTDKHISPDYIPKRSLGRVQRGLEREGLQYLAPELLEDMGNISPAVDLWALGVTLFRVLMGELPFSQPCLSNPNGVLSAIKQYCDAPELMLERLLFPPESSHTARFSSDAISVVVKLLSPNPDRRGDIASFARHPWVLPVDSPRSSPCSSKT